MSTKKSEFRKGQKMEIGFDLIKNHTGKYSTAQSELLGNFMEQGDYLKTVDPPPKQG